jgi:hypothetical protein
MDVGIDVLSCYVIQMTRVHQLYLFMTRVRLATGTSFGGHVGAPLGFKHKNQGANADCCGASSSRNESEVQAVQIAMQVGEARGRRVQSRESEKRVGREGRERERERERREPPNGKRREVERKEERRCLEGVAQSPVTNHPGRSSYIGDSRRHKKAEPYRTRTVPVQYTTIAEHDALTLQIISSFKSPLSSPLPSSSPCLQSAICISVTTDHPITIYPSRQ